MTASYDALALIPGTHAALPLGDVLVVPAQGFTAILRDTPAPARVLPQTRKAALAGAAARMAVLEAAMPFGPVITLQPGTRLHVAEVAALIAANRPTLEGLAARLDGCVQFQITVDWAADQVLTQFRDAPELRGLFAQGRTTASQLKAAISALATRLAADMSQHIEAAVRDSIRLPQGEDCLLNMVVLVPESQIAPLDTALTTIDAIWSDGLRIRQIGPTPAASFATLALMPITARDVTAATTLLGIPSAASADMITAARNAQLRALPQRANQIKTAADKVMAFARAGTLPVHYGTVLTEGQSIPSDPLQGAA